MNSQELIVPSETLLVSIVTVVLNDCEGLAATIESIRGQDYPHIEYIVIDGGSTDGTRELIEQSADCIATWVSEPDRGISDAFNKGIQRAHGDIIGILNAGDRYEPGAVSAVVEAYRASANRANFLCTGSLYIAEWDVVFYPDRNYHRKLPFMMPVINHPACFVALAVYQRVGLFNPDIRIAMDYEFLKRCHHAGVRIQCLDRQLVRIDGFGISESRYWQGYAEVLRYSDRKFLTLLLPPYILFNRIRLKIKKLLTGGDA